MRGLSEGKQAVLRTAKKAYREKLMAGTSGNMSMLIPAGMEGDAMLPQAGGCHGSLMIITPSSL